MAWNKTIPDNDELLVNFPALCRANWDAIELGTDANLQITNAKVAGAAAIADAKLAQLTTASKVSGASLTLLPNIPGAAGVIPDANSPHKLKADAGDATPQYLNSLINTDMFEISAGDTLELKDAGVEAEKLEGGSGTPGNWRFYGTEATGTFGFRLPDHGSLSGLADSDHHHHGLMGLADDDHSQYLNAARFVTQHDADDHSSLSMNNGWEFVSKTVFNGENTGDIAIATGNVYKIFFTFASSSYFRIRFNNDTGAHYFQSLDLGSFGGLVAYCQLPTDNGEVCGDFTIYERQGDSDAVRIYGNYGSLEGSQPEEWLFAGKWDNSTAMTSFEFYTTSGSLTGYILLYRAVQA